MSRLGHLGKRAQRRGGALEELLAVFLLATVGCGVFLALAWVVEVASK